MSEALHTPGPWAIYLGYDGSIEVCAGRPERINRTTAGTPIVAMICKHEDAEHFSGEANARLIAAAPDLLALVQEVLSIGNSLVRDVYGSEFLESALATIARATGKDLNHE